MGYPETYNSILACLIATRNIKKSGGWSLPPSSSSGSSKGNLQCAALVWGPCHLSCNDRVHAGCNCCQVCVEGRHAFKDMEVHEHDTSEA